jgi:hypothetical protein
MTNDETRPIPVDGPPAAPVDGAPVDGVNGARVDGVDGTQPVPAPDAPRWAWATTQPVVPPASSPYGPSSYGSPAAGQPEPVQPVQQARPEPAWADAEPDPWVDITPPRPGEVPAFGAPGPRPAGQGRRVLGVIGLVAAGAVAGALVVNGVGGFGGSNTAAVQPAGVTRNGAGANGVAPGGGVPGGAPGAGQDGVPGGQGLGGRFGGQNGEQRLIGTLTAVSGSKITVKTSAGTATYQVVPQTEIVREGAVASASDLKVGDRVLVHVFPASGSDGVLERVIAVPSTGAGAGPGSGTSGTSGTDDGGTSDT